MNNIQDIRDEIDTLQKRRIYIEKKLKKLNKGEYLELSELRERLYTVNMKIGRLQNQINAKSAGSMVIPIFNNRFKKALQNWFSIHEDIKQTHNQIYQKVKKIGRHAFGDRPFYPHVLRATAATFLVEEGLREHNLLSCMGWALSIRQKEQK